MSFAKAEMTPLQRLMAATNTDDVEEDERAYDSGTESEPGGPSRKGKKKNLSYAEFLM